MVLKCSKIFDLLSINSKKKLNQKTIFFKNYSIYKKMCDDQNNGNLSGDKNNNEPTSRITF